MKKMMMIMVLLFTTNAFSQAISDATTAIILSPFVTVTKLLETTAVASIGAIQSTQSLVQARGVAGKEQLKDELLALNEGMLSGQVKTISDIQQPGLRELFEEIMNDEKQMEDINSVVTTGSELHRVASAVIISLMVE